MSMLQMSTVVQAQLMFLDNVDERDITMHVDSPGGSVFASETIRAALMNLKKKRYLYKSISAGGP